MKFITVEQFKEQTIEVQKVFLDWWECELYDLYAIPWNRRTNTWGIGVCSNQIQADSINESKDIDRNIPIFTEGQLRCFIEDKTGCKTDMVFYMYDGYDIEISKPHYTDGYCLTQRKFEYLGEDLLQAYWKVACKIAKESV